MFELCYLCCIFLIDGNFTHPYFLILTVKFETVISVAIEATFSPLEKFKKWCMKVTSRICTEGENNFS